jgi:hypothetical protein
MRGFCEINIAAKASGVMLSFFCFEPNNFLKKKRRKRKTRKD